MIEINRRIFNISISFYFLISMTLLSTQPFSYHFGKGHTPEMLVLILIISHGTSYSFCLFYLSY